MLNDVHAEDADRMMTLWRGLFPGEAYSGAEFRMTARDGTEKWCWSAGRPIDDSGVQVGVQIRDADITLRKRAELRLRESERRARLVIETSNDAFLSTDLDGTVREWNRAAEQLFGVARGEAIGRSAFELVLPTTAARRWSGRWTRSAATARRSGRAGGAPGEAGEFAAEMRLWPIQTGGTLTLNAFVRDITERKRTRSGSPSWPTTTR